MTEKELLVLLQGDKELCIFGCGNVGRGFGYQILLEFKININYFCDSNPLLWGKEIIDGKKCISLDELKEKKPICFAMTSSQYIDEVKIMLEKIGIDIIISYDELCKMKINNYFPFMHKNQIAVYTCITGDYDYISEPFDISEKCDYYLISDKEPKEKLIYQYIDIHDVYEVNQIENTRKQNRFCKINAHQLFPDYRYSIYFDGNIRLKKGIYEKVNNFSYLGIKMMAMNHLDDIYLEAMRAIEHGRDNRETITAQVKKYWLEGFPEKYGSFYCGVMIREHNNPRCIEIMNDWWNEVYNYSQKDQISFPYVIWKNGYQLTDVGIIDKQYNKIYKENDYLDVSKMHKKLRN